MKTFFAMLVCLSALSTAQSYATVRETGGSPTFEDTIRKTQLGKTVLPAIEESLIAEGYESSSPMRTSWENEGKSFRAELWYRSGRSWSTVQIVLKGEFDKDLDVNSIEVNKQNP